MYQGKFNQKNPKQMEPLTPKAPAEAPKKGKKEFRLGGIIFYTLYFLFIALFCLATVLGLNWLDGWLRDFEASQPTVRAEQTFQQLFASPNWSELYVRAGVEDSLYENADSFAEYMADRVAGQSLSYMETSAGLSGDKKYNVRMGREKVASFTLKNQNASQEIATIPNWQLGEVELFFDRGLSYRIVKLESQTATVNGVALQEGDVLKVVTTVAEEYLPSGVAAPRLCTQEVSGLFTKPSVAIFDKDGTELEVTYDEESRSFLAAQAASEELPEDLKQIAIDASQYYALWMKAEVNSKKTLKTYFLEGTETYQSIIRTTVDYVQEGSDWEFTDISVTDYVRYSEDCFSVRVDMNLSETRSSGTVKDWPYSKSMIFQKQSSGKWLCTTSVNLDLNEEVGRVRLTFIHGDQVISSDFYGTDVRQIITPILSAPEGKVFGGWVQKTEDEAGNTVLQIVFEPDSSGHVSIPEGTALEPLTLYAHFVDAPAVG